MWWYFDVKRTVPDMSAPAEAIGPLDVSFAWRPQRPDPGDRMVSQAAINRRADALVNY
jgi:hypothetical protein